MGCRDLGFMVMRCMWGMGVLEGDGAHGLGVGE